MRKSSNEVVALLREYHARLAALYGDRLRGLCLYGSYARGEAEEYSDMDVAPVLAEQVDGAEERWRSNDTASELSLREDRLLGTMFLCEDEFWRRSFAIHRSISREGVAV
ncbi:MAG: nucleotidyltransferase domain-containing protein [Planctomycetes bacterium]|nr:nucleotidyltransferase domain-containing protein [Planctomycetota bacterium]